MAYDCHGNAVRAWTLGTAEDARQAMIGNVLESLAGGEALRFTAEGALHHVRAVETTMQSLAVRQGLGTGEGLFAALFQAR
jgi:hypothetical protein